MTKKWTMHGDYHAQQFHNADMFDETPVELPILGEEGLSLHAKHYAKGGSVISQLRKRVHEEKEMMPLHPAMKIPGVHIRTAEAGEPFFHGDK
jgi:hypothetical protein